ncbi:TauD/TfdA family dioxygenase [Nocardia jiangxiensis]|uniref:TauD/TfdA family dioxygenase n=1 Tax=Nocardia jiangxiensis TaxID=282685 RepID=A0ABW6SAF6_9NOCA|nr:TauD/TfdA family dioxygenase [Nocardia jiangxiensis]
MTERIKSAGTPIHQVTAQDCRDEVLGEFLDPIAHELRWGKGLVFVTGIPVGGSVPEEDTELMYWIIGSYFGDAVSQSRNGMVMGHVRAGQDAAEGRAYGSTGELSLHSDRIDILSLMCMHGAKVGGDSFFASSLALYDTIKNEHPEYVPILERGFPQWRHGEQAEGDEAITPYPVPGFAEHEGLVSALMSGNMNLHYIRTHADYEVSEDEEAALKYMYKLRRRPEFHLRAPLQVGEAVFINNYEVLHAREDFEDDEDPAKRRHLLRLWLQGRPPRPRVETMTVTHNRSGRQGIDPKG